MHDQMFPIAHGLVASVVWCMHARKFSLACSRRELVALCWWLMFYRSTGIAASLYVGSASLSVPRPHMRDTHHTCMAIMYSTCRR